MWCGVVPGHGAAQGGAGSGNYGRRGCRNLGLEFSKGNTPTRTEARWQRIRAKPVSLMPPYWFRTRAVCVVLRHRHRRSGFSVLLGVASSQPDHHGHVFRINYIASPRQEMRIHRYRSPMAWPSFVTGCRSRKGGRQRPSCFLHPILRCKVWTGGSSPCDCCW